MNSMQWLAGVEVSEGIAIGEAHLLGPSAVVRDRSFTTEEVPAELDRLHQAIGATDHQLGLISRQLAEQQHREGHLVLEAHRLMLKSDELVESARGLIRHGGLAAECAVRQAIDRIATVFARMRDPYLRDRGGDVEALGDRLLNTLLGRPAVEQSHGIVAGRIGVGTTLSPIDAYHFAHRQLAGLVTERGGQTSHAAIIVRTLKIPYVVGVPDLCCQVQPGDLLIVDGGSGTVIINPDEETLARFRDRRSRRHQRRQALKEQATGPTVTLDGERFTLSANIGALGELASALEVGAESVGLFRTELLYLDRRALPTEDEQYEDARQAVRSMRGRTVTFRTLDLGGDKLPVGLQIPEGRNPSLGIRAIRLSLLRPDIFRTQLRALFRASTEGPVRIMFPLVSSVSEMRTARRLCEQVRQELVGEGVAMAANVPIGAMLETPSAMLTADHLAQVCDFFSIGSNDLIQLAFAADRDDPVLRTLWSHFDPAVLRLLKFAIDAANVAGKPISLCGDLAASPAFTWVLLGLGLRELSMAPAHLSAVRSVVTGSRLAEARQLAATALELGSAEVVEELVMRAMTDRFPLEVGAADADLDDLRSPASPHDRVRRDSRPSVPELQRQSS